MAFSLPELPYATDALEPVYDQQTVEIHHGKHFNLYTNNLNKAVEAAGLGDKSIIEILTGLDAAGDQKTALTNHGGGYHNHKLFFENLAPSGSTKPSAELSDRLETTFGSMDLFKEQFSDKAAKHFGSGWAWLVEKDDELTIIDTHDQVSPITLGYKPILTIDVWEHAYYLKYKNVRPDWIKAFWEIVNWEVVEQRINSEVAALA